MNYLLAVVNRLGLNPAAKFLKFTPSRLQSYLKGTVTPYKPTLGKFRSAYARMNYSMLRTVGANTKIANRYKYASLDRIGQIMDTYSSTIQAMAEVRGIDAGIIMNASAGSKTATYADYQGYRIQIEEGEWQK